MSIPACRAALEDIADDLARLGLRNHAGRIRGVVQDMHRRSARRKTPCRARRMTQSLSAAIRTYAESNPGASQMEIAARFDVNIGRVSEAVNGRRTPVCKTHAIETAKPVREHTVSVH